MDEIAIGPFDRGFNRERHRFTVDLRRFNTPVRFAVTLREMPNEIDGRARDPAGRRMAPWIERIVQSDFRTLRHQLDGRRPKPLHLVEVIEHSTDVPTLTGELSLPRENP